jgi:hypothetical protein
MQNETKVPFLTKNKILKLILAAISLVILSILAVVLYLRITCQGIQIARLHNGITKLSIVSNSGNDFEPSNCNSFIIQATE